MGYYRTQLPSDAGAMGHYGRAIFAVSTSFSSFSIESPSYSRQSLTTLDTPTFWVYT
ncbi:MAG: hypothetical protein ACK4GN_00360 [Runella sp.]